MAAQNLDHIECGLIVLHVEHFAHVGHMWEVETFETLQHFCCVVELERDDLFKIMHWDCTGNQEDLLFAKQTCFFFCFFLNLLKGLMINELVFI